MARARRQKLVVAGAYALHRARQPAVTIAAMGAATPDAVAAIDVLQANGVAADLICITSADLLFRAQRARRGYGDAPKWILDTVFPADRATPLVTVLDGHPHTLAFLAGIHGVRSTQLGVTDFGQSGDLDTLYRYHAIDRDSIASAALALIH